MAACAGREDRLTKRDQRSVCALAYNLMRVMNIVGIKPLMAAIVA
jgi:hypothetical protein